jgi:hypothetical protein
VGDPLSEFLALVCHGAGPVSQADQGAAGEGYPPQEKKGWGLEGHPGLLKIRKRVVQAGRSAHLANVEIRGKHAPPLKTPRTRCRARDRPGDFPDASRDAK